jgi:hypothetical protein
VYVPLHVTKDAKVVKLQYVALNMYTNIRKRKSIMKHYTASASHLKPKSLANVALFRFGATVTASHHCTNR